MGDWRCLPAFGFALGYPALRVVLHLARRVSWPFFLSHGRRRLTSCIGRRTGGETIIVFMRTFVRQQVTIWLALLGVLFGTLAPTVSHAMAGNHPPAIEMQICSAAGMTTMLVELGDGSTPASNGTMHLFEHCPYCSQAGSLPALLPAAQPVLPAPACATGYPERFYQSATPLFPWTASSPRAPPVLG